MKHRITLFFLIALCITPLSALSYAPYAEVSSGACFTSILSYEDELLARTSMTINAAVHPLSMRMGGHILSLYTEVVLNTETLVHTHIQLLGFKSLGVGASYQCQLSSFYALSFSLGMYYGRYLKSDSACAYLQGGIGSIFYLLDFLSLSQRYQVAYRNGMLDHRVSLGLIIYPFGGRK